MKAIHSIGSRIVLHGYSAGPQTLPPSYLTLLLAVLFLVTAIGCDKALGSPPTYPQNTIQPQEEQEITQVRKEDALESTGEQSELCKEEQDEERSIMAGAVPTRPTPGTGPKSWPDLVGLDAEEAKKKILQEHPNLQVLIVPEGMFMTMDYNLRRVRIHTNKEKKVSKAPQQG